MSYFISHHPCPKCGSRDNFAEYDDGHFWCFGCRHFVPPKIKSIKQVESALEGKKILTGDSLPDDYSIEIPREPYSWLKSYGLSTKEIEDNHLGWSNKNEMLIFPYYGADNELLCWQGRFFPKRNPKVFTRGYPDRHLLIHASDNVLFSDSVVVVEDAISAIKVARICNSTELLGSNLSMHKAIGLSRIFSKLILWLDNDKIKEMIKFSEKYRSLFDSVEIIISDKDPKYYSTEEIKEFLNGI